eukprot:XP_024453184.1 uncharacterized protein LOC112326912 [Populus trichocarpa]
MAFMFFTRGSLPMLLLWERFYRGNDKLYSIYVHAHPKYRIKASKDSPFHEVKWGHMSTIDAEKSLLANALLDFSNEWFLLLLESCIPVCKFHHHTQLCGVLYELSSDGRGRYFHQILPEIQLHQWRKGSQ